MQRILVLLVLGGLLLAAVVLAISRSADHAVDAYVAIQAQPDSAAELALLSRQTPPIAVDHTRSWAGAGLLALALVVVGAMVIVLRGGTDFLRQWRLVRRRPAPLSSQPCTPTPPPLPGTIPYYAPPVDNLPRVQRPQELPTWTEND